MCGKGLLPTLHPGAQSLQQWQQFATGQVGQLGGSRDKYIKYEAAWDQFLSRTLCGLDPLSISFSGVSPPFFDLPPVGIAELDSWIHATMRGSRVTTTNNLSRCCRYVFVFVFLLLSTSYINILFLVYRYMYVSMIYHKNWLHEIMHPANALFAISMFTEPLVVSGIADTISEVVKVVRMYEDCQGAALTNIGHLTGIPAHIGAILNKMQKLEESVTDTEAVV